MWIIMKTCKSIYIAGSGGKTTLSFWMADWAKQQGKRAVVLTTTHMMAEEGCILYTGNPSEWKKSLKRKLDEEGLAQTGVPVKAGKITWIGEVLYKEVQKMADVIFIEADGSKRLPAKMPNASEPVIFPDADAIYVVFGLSAVGKPIHEICHRYELADFLIEETLTEESAAKLLNNGYVDPLQKKYPQTPVTVVLNQADDDKIKVMGETIAEQIACPVQIISLKGGMKGWENETKRNLSKIMGTIKE